MQARISVITLSVLDLEASLRFYRDGLGFPSEGIMGKSLNMARWLLFNYNLVLSLPYGHSVVSSKIPVWSQAQSVRRK